MALKTEQISKRLSPVPPLWKYPSFQLFLFLECVLVKNEQLIITVFIMHFFYIEIEIDRRGGENLSDNSLLAFGKKIMKKFPQRRFHTSPTESILKNKNNTFDTDQSEPNNENYLREIEIKYCFQIINQNFTQSIKKSVLIICF
ncbi:hypothetical protein M0812_03116 [Anaeramoeba flamelloides]|uniref:Uncharacterized protein n=1 Tax=Anaeramoeba flamelloides TaxID=1746091 RepID=A0AAV7YRL5_9EUKA|nr:hypothetical protein M0812_03116 [Anaeramoeba flamelloides]